MNGKIPASLNGWGKWFLVALLAGATGSGGSRLFAPSLPAAIAPVASAPVISLQDFLALTRQVEAMGRTLEKIDRDLHELSNRIP